MVGLETIYIYKITCLPLQKVYVGQTTASIKERLRQHRKSVTEYDPENSLAYALNTYPDSAFLVEIVACCNDATIANKLETLYIEKENCLRPSGFNLSSGPESSFCKNTKVKLSNAKIGLQFVEQPKPMKGLRKTSSKRGVDKRKKVVGVHLQTGEIVELDSMSAEPAKFDPRLISACCRGKRRHHRGYTWSFKNE